MGWAEWLEIHDSVDAVDGGSGIWECHPSKESQN